jgi:hypothetical protein
VAHFQDEDPIKFNPQPGPTMSGDPEKDAGDLPSSMSVNLETRRKRRDSSAKLAIRRMSVFHSPPERVEDESGGTGKTINQTLPIRAGAKRKLAVREGDGQAEIKTEDFNFSRKGASTPDEDSAKSESKSRNRKETTAASVTILPERKALGESKFPAKSFVIVPTLIIAIESINTDPLLSPKKPITKSSLKSEEPNPKKPVSQQLRDPAKPKPRVRVSRTAPETIDLPSSHTPDIIETAEIPLQPALELPPKTPAPTPDLFSPPATEPSTARPLATRDTPPPTDLLSSSNGIDVNGGRRRARAQVNYAEPSLNTKMRRPTKELCDAVGKDGKPLSVTGMGNRVTEKSEPIEDGGAWKSLPSISSRDSAGIESGSPLSKKSSSAPTRVPTLATKNSESCADEQAPSQHPESSAVISAILRDTRVKKPQTTNGTTTMQAPDPTSQNLSRDNKKDLSGEENKRSSLAIFDFTSSSPPRDIADKQRPDSREGTRGSRRHSSISSITGTSSKAKPDDAAGRGSSKATSTSAKHKRQSSVESGPALASFQGQLHDDASAQGLGVGRSERAAARRRSMML